MLDLDMAYDVVQVRGEQYLFIEERVDEKELPEGLYKYEVRGSDEGYEPCEISECIVVNFYGTIVSDKPITKWDDEFDNRHFLYLEFENEPAYYEDAEGMITSEPLDLDGEENNPHYFPKENEWSFISNKFTLNELKKGVRYDSKY